MKRWSSRKLALAVALGTALSAAAPALALDIDLTPTLAANPRVQQEVAQLCKRACLGNQRRSWLESAIVHADLGGSLVTVTLKLRSRQAAKNGPVLYDETATVKVDADLSLAGCGLANVRAASNNDLYRALLRAFAREIKAAILRRGRFC
jgi:hypothetical protein